MLKLMFIPRFRLHRLTFWNTYFCLFLTSCVLLFAFTFLQRIGWHTVSEEEKVLPAAERLPILRNIRQVAEIPPVNKPFDQQNIQEKLQNALVEAQAADAPEEELEDIRQAIQKFQASGPPKQLFPQKPVQSQEQITSNTSLSTSTTSTTTTEPLIPKLDGSELNHLDNITYPHLLSGSTFLPNRKVVHFDLKGAPPKVKYFLELFPFLRQLGATSILMEYEDMFPYTGVLYEARNLNAYTQSELSTILSAANKENLEVIPLVQTFGHLEWLLKLPRFAHLRENPRIPQVICFGLDEAWSMMREILDQVAGFHKPYGLPFLHIGADEAFEVGLCGADKELLIKLRGKQQVILWQISRTAKFIRKKYRTRVLAWHDMFSHANPTDLVNSGMAELIEPVVWDYQENLNLNSVFLKLKVFPYIWAGSSFKGADGPSQYYSNPPHYMANHNSWLQTMAATRGYFKQFRGVIMTGWSRFDHLAVLCELFPVGFPSLALNLMILNGVGNVAPKALKDLLGCKIEPRQTPNNCAFPGSKIYYLVQELRHIKEYIRLRIYERDEFQGWMSRTAMKFQFSSPYHLKDVLQQTTMMLDRLETIKRSLKREMDIYFYMDAINEFIYQYVGEDFERLENVKSSAEGILAKSYFPRRPFPELLDQQETTAAKIIENLNSTDLKSNSTVPLKL